MSERFTIQESGRTYQIHPTQVANWKEQLFKVGQTMSDRPVKDFKTQAQEKETRYLKMMGSKRWKLIF